MKEGPFPTKYTKYTGPVRFRGGQGQYRPAHHNPLPEPVDGGPEPLQTRNHLPRKTVHCLERLQQETRELSVTGEPPVVIGELSRDPMTRPRKAKEMCNAGHHVLFQPLKGTLASAVSLGACVALATEPAFSKNRGTITSRNHDRLCDRLFITRERRGRSDRDQKERSLRTLG
jgi:hypothetical protein